MATRSRQKASVKQIASPAARFSQRVALSLFRLASLRADYIPRTDVHKKMAAKWMQLRPLDSRHHVKNVVSCECGRCAKSKLQQSARYCGPMRRRRDRSVVEYVMKSDVTLKRVNKKRGSVHESVLRAPTAVTLGSILRLQRKLQEDTAHSLLDVRVGPRALRRLPMLDVLGEEDLYPCEYLTTLALCFHALEKPPKTRADSGLTKRQLADAISKTVFARWEPQVSRTIHLPQFPVRGLEELVARSFKQLKLPPKDSRARLAAMLQQFAPCKLKVSDSDRRFYSKLRDNAIDGCAEYLVRLSLSDALQLRHSAGLLRWGIDIACAAAAAQTALLCEAPRRNFDKFNRRRAKGLLALSHFMWDSEPFDRITYIADIYDCLDLTPGLENAQNIANSSATLASAAALFQRFLNTLAVDPAWFFQAWDIGLSRCPSLPWKNFGRVALGYFKSNVPEGNNRLDKQPDTANDIDSDEDSNDETMKSIFGDEFDAFSQLFEHALREYLKAPRRQTAILSEFQLKLEKRCPRMLRVIRGEGDATLALGDHSLER